MRHCPINRGQALYELDVLIKRCLWSVPLSLKFFMMASFNLYHLYTISEKSSMKRTNMSVNRKTDFYLSIPFIGEIFFFSLNKVIIFMIFEILWLCWLFLEDGILDVERLSLSRSCKFITWSYSNFNNFHSFRNLNDILIFLQDYICKFIYISNIMSIILNKNIRFTNFSKLCGIRFYDFIFSHGLTNTIRSYRQLFVFFTRIEKNFHSGCRARFSRGYDFS